MELTPGHLSGRTLYGDDLSREEIERWYADEENGYYNLAADHFGLLSECGYSYEYDALNRFHAFDLVTRRNWTTCLAMGCAAGDDVAPLARAVEHFIAVEPAEQWWRDEIGGKPARYLKPSVLGDLPLEDSSVDLATSIGVLHHIPNVSHVLTELARVVRSGGLFVIREPISSMGDWRKPRVGLTKNERGLPEGWLVAHLEAASFRIIRRRHCMFPLTAQLGRVASHPYNRRALVIADWLASWFFKWNSRYWRPHLLQKFAPGSVFIVAERM